ncbi:hypothetical protein [Pseudorhodoplanes sp.]|uniref:hypothetical protein n=1 Tax=Pseudorhodoplanes sp. TaxID=1934341 RepID=UPI002C557756|nr:hypothetical protein [Pseudorhodoplanes sp.]HWV53852.1 hypothetical protein [Pseudorhodoplanes sp.]
MTNPLLWLSGFNRHVQREADLLIGRYGALAYRYALDHVRLGQLRKRKRDEKLYAAVAEEIAARKSSRRGAVCAAAAMWLPDWLPVLNGTLAAFA